MKKMFGLLLLLTIFSIFPKQVKALYVCSGEYNSCKDLTEAEYGTLLPGNNRIPELVCDISDDGGFSSPTKACSPVDKDNAVTKRSRCCRTPESFTKASCGNTSICMTETDRYTACGDSGTGVSKGSYCDTVAGKRGYFCCTKPTEKDCNDRSQAFCTPESDPNSCVYSSSQQKCVLRVSGGGSNPPPANPTAIPTTAPANRTDVKCEPSDLWRYNNGGWCTSQSSCLNSGMKNGPVPVSWDAAPGYCANSSEGRCYGCDYIGPTSDGGVTKPGPWSFAYKTASGQCSWTSETYYSTPECSATGKQCYDDFATCEAAIISTSIGTDDNLAMWKKAYFGLAGAIAAQVDFNKSNKVDGIDYVIWLKARNEGK